MKPDDQWRFVQEVAESARERCRRQLHVAMGVAEPDADWWTLLEWVREMRRALDERTPETKVE